MQKYFYKLFMTYVKFKKKILTSFQIASVLRNLSVRRNFEVAAAENMRRECRAACCCFAGRGSSSSRKDTERKRVRATSETERHPQTQLDYDCS